MTEWRQALPVLAVIVAVLVLMAVLQPAPEDGSAQVGLAETPVGLPSGTVSTAPDPGLTAGPSPPPGSGSATPSPGTSGAVPGSPSGSATSPGTEPANAEPSGAGRTRTLAPSFTTVPEVLPTSFPCPTATVPSSFSVVTYNIKGGRSRRGTGYSATRIVRELSRWQPDVVLVQEIERFRRRSRYHDMPNLIARQLGMNAVFGANVVRRPARRGLPPQQYGTAILSRHPITGWSNRALPNLPGDEQRGLLRATVQVAGRTVHLFNTHLQHNSERARTRQILAVRRIVSRFDGPVVLGGDLNAGPRTRVLGIARSIAADTWTAVGRGPGGTVPAERPKGRIDYLMHTGGLRPVSAQVIRSDASDHNAVGAVYEVPAPELPCG